MFLGPHGVVVARITFSTSEHPRHLSTGERLASPAGFTLGVEDELDVMTLPGSKNRLIPVTCDDGRTLAGMMITRVPPPALPDLRPALQLAHPARPLTGVQERGIAGVAARGRWAAPHQAPAEPGLGLTGQCWPR